MHKQFIFLPLTFTCGQGDTKHCLVPSTLCDLRTYIMWRELGNVSSDLETKVNVKGQIMYFLVNASPKRLYVTTPNLTGA